MKQFLKLIPVLFLLIGSMEYISAQGTSPEVTQLSVGDQAPEFAALNQFEEEVSLKELTKKDWVVLVFYRGSWCPHCKKHLSAFQDSLAMLKKAGAFVVAVSPQLPVYQDRMAEEVDVDYPLLYDEGFEIMKSYGVDFQLDKGTVRKYKLFGINLDKYNGDDTNTLPVPATFLIDKEGTIQYVHYDENYKERSNVQEILKHIQK